MAITQNHVINIQPGVSAPLVIHCSQGDTGTQINLTVVNGDEEFDCSSYACSVHGVRSDGGNWGPITCTVSGSTVCFSLTSAMTAVAGSCLAEVSIGTVGTANFALLVENATFESGVTYSNDVSVYQNILTAVQTGISNETAERVAAVETEKNERVAADDSLSSRIFQNDARINNLVGNTGNSNSEIVDARVGVDGNVYPNLGTAIRTQVNDLKSDISDLSNIIATKKDGLLCSGFSISTTYKKVIVYSNGNVVKVGIEPTKNKYLIKANKAPFMVAFSYNDLETSDITTSSIIQSESKSIIVDNDYLCNFLYVGNSKDLEFEIYEIKKSDIRDCVYPEYFGAKGDGITDDFLSLQSAINFSISNNLKLEFIKGKTYAISKGLTISIPKNIYIDFNYAEIRAIANMQRMISIHCSDDIISSDTPTFDYNNIKNIRLNHNGYSGHSIYIDYGNHLTIDGVLINDCKGNAIRVEAGGINLNNGYIICKHGSSVGINISTSDSHFNDIIIIDADTAIYNSGTNFFTKIHGWNTQGGVEGTIFFSHHAGNAHLVQCQCDTYETGYYIGTDRRLSLTNCTYYFNSNVYKGNKTPIIFKYADYSRYYSRNTSCINCTFDAFSTEVVFTNFNAMMINQVGCWYKGSISLSKSEIGLVLSENVSDIGNAWNKNSLQYKDDTVKVQLALNIDGKGIGTTEKSIGTIPQTYWYPTTFMCVPCMLFVDEWDTKWYMGYVFVNNNNGVVMVKANQNLSYKKLLCNFEYDKPQVIYKGQ